MSSSFFRRLCCLALLPVLAITSLAEEPAIIAKARAYLGSETALNAIKSVKFTGTVTTTDQADASKKTTAAIEIIVQQPDQQRVVARSNRGVETTAVDGYEGWQRFQDGANPQNQRLVVLRPDGVKRLRAQAWENLSFYRGLEKQGGRIEERGDQTIDGVACRKVAFIHTPTIVFVRYFDLATGRLVQTDTDDGGTTREVGEQTVSGVRFPKAMNMAVKGPKGEVQSVHITFEVVTVNESFPDAVFRMPSPGSN
jgi:outer membrane lipoprotein-sorting protein